MKLHYLQHVAYETPACILDWIKQNGVECTSTKFFNKDELPNIDSLDFLLIMGGPMGVNDESLYTWLKKEKEFIKKCIENDKIILGICLGAQLIANVLGENVYKNKHKEVGWFPIKITQEAKNTELLNSSPDELTVFHWHGDTFDIPNGAIHLAESEGCKNQAFVLNERIVGLQFHFEVTEDSLNEMVKFGKGELVKNIYIQNEKEILDGKRYIEENNKIMCKLLDSLTTKL